MSSHVHVFTCTSVHVCTRRARVRQVHVVHGVPAVPLLLSVCAVRVLLSVHKGRRAHVPRVRRRVRCALASCFWWTDEEDDFVARDSNSLVFLFTGRYTRVWATSKTLGTCSIIISLHQDISISLLISYCAFGSHSTSIHCFQSFFSILIVIN